MTALEALRAITVCRSKMQDILPTYGFAMYAFYRFCTDVQTSMLLTLSGKSYFHR